MAERTCSIDDCEKPALARGWCSTHYTRWRKHGDPSLVKTPRSRKGEPLFGAGPVERFWCLVHRRTEGCWSWVGATYATGYGYFDVLGSDREPAHRLAYRLFVGPIPDGLDIDHVCHNRDRACPGGVGCLHRRCVNPAHLEPATRRTNVLRGMGTPAVNARKTHCKNGHPLDEANTYVYYAGRRCRACDRQRAHEYRDRKRAACRESA